MDQSRAPKRRTGLTPAESAHVLAALEQTFAEKRFKNEPDAAEKLGLSQSYISLILTKSRPATATVAHRLAKFRNVDYRELVGGTATRASDLALEQYPGFEDSLRVLYARGRVYDARIIDTLRKIPIMTEIAPVTPDGLESLYDTWARHFLPTSKR